MEELFKSLSESVSEECFDDIMGIVEEYINEILVGDYKEKGAGKDELGQYGMKKELQKHFAGKLRGIRKHETKKIKGAEKEARELYNKKEQIKKEEKQLSNQFDQSNDKVQKVRQDYEQAIDGTPLKAKLDQEWDKVLNKSNKVFKKLQNKWGERDAVADKRSNLIANAADSETKANKANELMGGGAKKADSRVGEIAHNGTRKYSWERKGTN